jgi:hypothetical protein
MVRDSFCRGNVKRHIERDTCLDLRENLSAKFHLWCFRHISTKERSPAGAM